ncbi:DUF1643 domain-containing protein [bacterium M00.F.Ca.ET.228.01.1.1]|nr:DUF1643 domain-containing protein [bacterium M00.F.Ca.ET.228.01.1.1]TGR99151.1 DUF1643 domain-containing protein [bacterium M00.F.Ca.ET.191.01.1.1]TGU03463.1 DUF1643 domain-containing protein [bacterium M00.F.Ca.ET.155.01.1.1]
MRAKVASHYGDEVPDEVPACILSDTDLAGERGCVLSDCGAYRYRLWREWDRTRPTLAFLMLNPSTADHLTDDATITRCMSRAITGKFGRLEVVNLFPLRSTDPDELLTHPDPVGPRSPADGAVLDVIERAHTAICAWGAHAAAPPRAAEIMHILGIVGWRSRLMHLGLNKDGSPKHPLYVARTIRPTPFEFHCHRE